MHAYIHSYIHEQAKYLFGELNVSKALPCVSERWHNLTLKDVMGDMHFEDDNDDVQNLSQKDDDDDDDDGIVKAKRTQKRLEKTETGSGKPGSGTTGISSPGPDAGSKPYGVEEDENGTVIFYDNVDTTADMLALNEEDFDDMHGPEEEGGDVPSDAAAEHDLRLKMLNADDRYLENPLPGVCVRVCMCVPLCVCVRMRICYI